jgi:hypothetical protein
VNNLATESTEDDTEAKYSVLSVCSVCRQEVISQIVLVATPFIRGNPTAECVDGNAHVVSLRDNVEKKNQKIRFGLTARIRTL